MVAGITMCGRHMHSPGAGYSIHDGVFLPVEMTEAISALDRSTVGRTRAGVRHVLAEPFVRELATDPRALDIARLYLGPTAIPYRATLFNKSLGRNWLVVWHQDTTLPIRRRVPHPAWGPWSVKADVLYSFAPASALNTVVALRVHFDDSTAENGPLRVLPGTHGSGVLEQVQVDELVAGTHPVSCTTSAGGVIAMRPLLVHASSKARSATPRRVLHIEYAAAIDLGDGVQLAVDGDCSAGE